MKYPKLYLFFLFVGLGWSCESRPKAPIKPTDLMAKSVEVVKKVEPVAKVAPPKKTDVWYSPFVIDVSSKKMVFETITFKDVTQGEVSPSRETMMESLADSLGMAIGQDPAFAASYELRYDEEITKPSNHRACGHNHLYIDVWEMADQFGYSMWSGCSADDEFAHSSAIRTKTDDPLERVAPLVTAIHKQLAQAHSTKCFLKTC